MANRPSQSLRSSLRFGALVSALVIFCPSLDKATFRARSAVAASAPRPGAVASLVPPAPRRIPVTLFNVNSHEVLLLAIPADGVLAAADAERLTAFMRCRRTGRERPLDAGVVAILGDLAEAYPGRVIDVVSGYRAPPYGKPHSKHFIGHAVDLRVRGVATAAVRDYLWRSHAAVGVGHYTHEDFVHVDYRPGEPDMAWTVGGGGRYRYQPGWATRARAVAVRSAGV